MSQDRFETVVCERHGAFESRIAMFAGREHRTGCPTCREVEDAKLAEFERAELAKRLSGWFRKESGVPEICHSAQMTGPQGALDWFEQMLAGNTHGPLVIVGDVGTGKTSLACAMVREFVMRGQYGFYVSSLVYCRKIRDTWGRNADLREDEMIERFARASFLVIDEIGAGKAADEPIIQELICARYDAAMMKRTVVVSNVAANNMASKIGERSADRIRDRASLVAMSGSSLRKPAA